MLVFYTAYDPIAYTIEHSPQIAPLNSLTTAKNFSFTNQISRNIQHLG